MDPISRVELEPPRLLGELELVLGLDEAGQGLLVGGAVDAAADGAEPPGAKLRIGVGDFAELALSGSARPTLRGGGSRRVGGNSLATAHDSMSCHCHHTNRQLPITPAPAAR